MDLHITIIGAGVVGLAIAAELSKKHENIFVFEKNSGFGQETSSRNSEVIHSGIYYPQNSLKTELCSVGNRLLYDWCDSYRVPYQKIGKFIIAINEEDCENLQLLFNNGIKNNIPGLKLVTSEEFTEIEPKIKAKKAIFSETTGIVDSHSLMASFEAYASNNGATFAYNHQINNISKIKGGYNLKILSGNETFFYTSEIVINAAGLMADKIAALPGINPDEADYQLSYAKGHYFRLKPGMSNLAEHLIYPVPQKNWIGLGIHITKDLSGSIKFGPDIHYLPDNILDYSYEPGIKEKFIESIHRYAPLVKFDDIQEDQVGIRPKLQKEGEGFRDFIINEESDKGFPGFWNLIGIESPGLTSAIAIGKYIAEKIDKSFENG